MYCYQKRQSRHAGRWFRSEGRRQNLCDGTDQCAHNAAQESGDYHAQSQARHSVRRRACELLSGTAFVEKRYRCPDCRAELWQVCPTRGHASQSLHYSRRCHERVFARQWGNFGLWRLGDAHRGRWDEYYYLAVRQQL